MTDPRIAWAVATAIGTFALAVAVADGSAALAVMHLVIVLVGIRIATGRAA